MSLVDRLLEYAFRGNKRSALPDWEQNWEKRQRLSYSDETTEKKHRFIWNIVNSVHIAITSFDMIHTGTYPVAIYHEPFHIDFTWDVDDDIVKAEFKIYVDNILKGGRDPVIIKSYDEQMDLLNGMYVMLDNLIILEEDKLLQFVNKIEL
tara:strand:+ start:1355 stop:1804 length:450 start_codon:yes stop_codon:yes gene_type:complete